MNQDRNSRPSTTSSKARPQTNSSQRKQIRSNYDTQKTDANCNNVSQGDNYYSPDRPEENQVKNFGSDDQQSPTHYDKPSSAYSNRKRINSVQKSDYTSVKANSLASTMYRTFNGTHYTASGVGQNTMKNSIDFSKLDPTKFVDGMYQEIPLWRQSVATWRYSAPSHKFPQAQRFPDPKLPGTYKNKISIPNTLKKRSTSFGLGKNTDIFPPKHIEKASTTPAPNGHKVKRYLEDQNHYKIRYPETPDLSNTSYTQQRSCSKSGCETERSREKRSLSQTHCITQGVEPGKSFGLSYEHYRKNYLKYADKMIYSPLFQEGNPPPNTYNVSEKIGDEKRKFSIYQRLKMFNEYCDKQVPPLTTYKVNEKPVIQKRFKDISFGYGQKINIAAPLNDNPGPQYAVKRDFDEFDKFSNHYLQF
ncbi:hypothetical protein ABPG74_000299 [Tetrahymena malaccensis]